VEIIAPPAGKGPGVVIAHPWWGLNKTMRAYAAALASEGFAVALPDVFQGRTAESIEDAQTLADTQWSPDAPAVLVAALDRLSRNSASTGSRFGIVGFSYGAFFALGLAGRADLPLSSIVTYYAVRDLPPKHVPILGHLAQTDPFDSSESTERYTGALARAGSPNAAITYSDTRHWFAETDRPEYDAAAAALAFQRTVAFLRNAAS
jgi:carboxymethylenebutenolidase